MSKHIVWRVLIVILLCGVGISNIKGQVELDATYVSPDGSFSFNYPNGGSAILDDESYVGSVRIMVALYGHDYNINVFSPWLTQIQIGGAKSLAGARDMLRQSMVYDETTLEINTFQSYQLLEFVDETGGCWTLIELDEGAYGLVGVHADDQRPRRVRNIARAIAASYSYRYPLIQQYDGAWEDVIAELRRLHVLENQGTLVFSEPEPRSDWGQEWIAEGFTPHANVVMSAAITVTGEGHCGLMAHVQRPGTGDSGEVFALMILLKLQASHSSVGFSDSYGVVSRTFDFTHLPVEAGTPHRYLLITHHNELSIYIDGNPLVEQVPIAPVAGTYGLYFEPLSEDSQCVVSDFWVYQYDSPVSEQACHADVLAETEGRLWPNRGPAIQTFAEGDRLPVVCHYTVESGETWYLLRNGAWIPPGSVRLSGDCTDMLTIH